MKSVIQLLIFLFVSVGIFAQDAVLSRSGKEITVNSPATNSAQGQVKLTGDLSGTADAPTVPALSDKIEGTGTLNYVPKFTASKTLANSLIYDSGTNIGIGTASPSAQLHVKGDLGGILLERTAGTAPFDQGFLKLMNKDGGSFQLRSLSGANDGFNITNGNAGTNYMTGLSSGFIGIGTATPTNKLEIKHGTDGNSGLRFTNLTSASTASSSSSKVLALNSSGDVILTNVPGTQNIVAFSVNANPNTAGTTFSPNTPNDISVVYQSSIDNSMWTYNGSTYVTYNAPASTAWYTAGTSNDAGNSKTSNIYRSGNVGIGIVSPVTKLHIQGATAVQAVNASESMFRMSRPSQGGVKWDNIAQFNLGTHYDSGNAMDAKSRLDIGLTNGADNTTLTTVMTWLANGKVGIGTTAPTANLDVVGGLSLRNVVGAAGSNYGMEFNTNSNSPRIDWVYNGSYTGAFAADADFFFRLQNSKQGSGGFRFMTNPSGTAIERLTILNNGNVGVANTSPSAPLVVQGVSGTGALKLVAPVVAASGDNWWIGFGHGPTSPDSNDRARIGVDIQSGGAGRLFFTTGIGGSQTRAMYIDEAQKVGIGTSSPTAQLEVATTNAFSSIIRRASTSNYTPANIILQKTFSADPATHTAVLSGDHVGRILFSASNGTNYPSNGTDIVGYAAGNQTTANNGGGISFRTVPMNSVAQAVERLRIDHNGYIGINNTTPAAILDVASTTSGVLIPRMTTTQRTGITVSASTEALLVFDTDVDMFYYYNAATTSWTPINVGTVKTQSGTAYTLSAVDNGRVLDFTSSTAVSLTVPSTLPVGFQVSITQAGAGQVTFVAGTGMTINNRYSATKTSGQWAKAGLEVRASGSAVLSGDVQ